jgi:membrane protein implicated in regulation of membrane protease activity
MSTLYVICLIFGGILIGISIFAGTEADMDADADVGLDSDADLGVEGGEGIAAAARFLSLRNLIFFIAFFGLTGTLFTGLGLPAPVTLTAAIGMGLVSGGLMHKLMGYLRESEVGEESGVADVEGMSAKVFIDLSKRRRGKICVRKGDRWLSMVAVVHEEAERDRFKAGDSVTIVSVKEGTAYVAGDSFIQ